jgi:hypothetical protein
VDREQRGHRRERGAEERDLGRRGGARRRRVRPAEANAATSAGDATRKKWPATAIATLRPPNASSTAPGTHRGRGEQRERSRTMPEHAPVIGRSSVVLERRAVGLDVRPDRRAALQRRRMRSVTPTLAPVEKNVLDGTTTRKTPETPRRDRNR